MLPNQTCNLAVLVGIIYNVLCAFEDKILRLKKYLEQFYNSPRKYSTGQIQMIFKIKIFEI